MSYNRIAILSLILLYLGLPGCQQKCKEDGDPTCWVQALSDPKQVRQAIREIKSADLRQAEDALIQTLRNAADKPRIREEIAEIFDKWQTKKALMPLLEAIDYTVGPNSDGKKAKSTNRANQKIASALGAIGDTQASGALIKLLKTTKNNNVKRSAIRALGKLQCKEAIPPLLQILNNKNAPKVLRANVVHALGDIGDPQLVPPLILALYQEGATFFAHANLALVKIGEPAVAPLIATMKGQNKDVKRLLEGNVSVLAGAMEANAAQVLGDIGSPKAVEPLLEMMSKVSKWEEENKLLVIVRLIKALGDIGAKRAIKPIMTHLSPKFWDVRTAVADALISIGDRSVVPELFKVAEQRSHPRTRVPIIDAIGNLATDKMLPAMEKYASKHKDRDLNNAAKKAIKRLKIHKECKQQVDCWIGKLKDQDEVVREKAAYELGRLGDAKAIDALIGVIADNSTFVRWAVIDAFSKLNSPKPIPAIAALVDNENNPRYRVVNEKYRRLLARLRRTAQ